MPVFYYFNSKELTLILIGILTIITILVDILSKPGMVLNGFIDKYLGFMIRSHEKSKKWWRLNGASWITISASIVFALFPKFIAITSFFILIIADLTAALVGRRFGKIKIKRFKKTFEGSSAFFISSALICLLMGYFHNASIYFYLFGFAACLLTTIAELVSKRYKIDDNLLIPLTFSIFMTATDILFLTQQNSFRTLI